MTAYSGPRRPGRSDVPAARRWKSLDAEIRTLSAQIDALVRATAPAQVELHGLGTADTHRRDHARTQVLILVHDLHVRVINAATGELIRELTIDPARDYQPLGRPPGPQPKTPRTQ